MSNILITGGCGFVGSNIATALLRDGHEVTCFDNLSRRGSEILLNRVVEYGGKFVFGDIRNKEDFDKLRDQYQVMIECSAEPSVLIGADGSEAYYMINNNLFGAVNCFEFCRKQKMGIIFLSTSRVYPYNIINSLRYRKEDTRYEYDDHFDGIGEDGVSLHFPLEGYRSLYGATKLAAEYILQEYSVNYSVPSIINRCGVIAGPWQLGKVDQGVFTYWMVNHYFNKSLQYIGFGGEGKQVRDLLHIDDLVNLVKIELKVLQNNYGAVYNVGGSRFSNLSLLEATNICREITGNSPPVERETKNRPADIIWYIADISHSVDTLRWHPVKNAYTILEDIFLWLKENERKFINILKVKT